MRGLRLLTDLSRERALERLESEIEERVRVVVVTRAPSRTLLSTGNARDDDEMEAAEALARELDTALSKVDVEVLRVGEDSVPAHAARAAEAPVFVVGRDGEDRVRFVGVPRVNLFRALLDAVRRASAGDAELEPAFERRLRTLPTPVHVQLFATSTCPACKAAVSAVHRFALASTQVRADVINAGDVPELARLWNVYGVPTAIVNGRLVAEGAVPEETLLELVLHAADPTHPAPRLLSLPFRGCGRLDGAVDGGVTP